MYSYLFSPQLFTALAESVPCSRAAVQGDFLILVSLGYGTGHRPMKWHPIRRPARNLFIFVGSSCIALARIETTFMVMFSDMRPMEGKCTESATS